ncbi:hypothetical protein SAMN06297280_1869 [Arsukibacterium tuosuense]|uniref:Uncharacterized protein n=1 Tax=Arsukibacterium tuosuense TaxID=1323745 RepID=A0A285ITW2_9GAMM|nr:hypothetical protein SAMN06297280_1869 [Arsukibacterium tuosuense]
MPTNYNMFIIIPPTLTKFGKSVKINLRYSNFLPQFSAAHGFYMTDPLVWA